MLLFKITERENVEPCVQCCDRKSRAACAQSFALWQQATMEFTCHDHSIIACSRHMYVSCCSSRTSRSWWITQSTQHHRRGCNNTTCLRETFLLMKLNCLTNTKTCLSSCKKSISQMQYIVKWWDMKDGQNILQLSMPLNVPLSPACATFFANVCNAITRQPIELESCSNHLRIQQVF